MDLCPNTEWRRCIGCLKLQVIFRKRATNFRDLLRKMTYKDKAFYGSSPSNKHLCQQANIDVRKYYRVASISRLLKS